MDLGIKGKNALVCAASKGLGRGCAEALAEAGVNLTICARTEKDIVATANEIRLKYLQLQYCLMLPNKNPIEYF